MRRPRLLLLLLFLLPSSLFMGACASPLPVEQAHAYLRDTLLGAKIRHSKGENVEALVMVDSVLRVDQEFPGAQQLRKSIVGMLGDVAKPHPRLGSNRLMRQPAERSWDQKIMLWLPDRIFDLFDVFSFDVHVGPGLFGHLHVTRGFQVGGGYRAVGGIGLHSQRSLGGQTQYESRASATVVGFQAFTGHKAGASGVFATSSADMGTEAPQDRVYQEFRDYWALGGALTAGVAGLDLALHPLQLADFFAGLVTIDFLNDDAASSSGLRFSRDERRLLLRVARLLRDPDSIEAYYRALSKQKQAPKAKPKK